MTQGVTGTYAINGTDFPLQPSYGRWETRGVVGVDGNGRTIYPKVRSFEIGWDLVPIDNLDDIIGAQISSVTGSVIVDLPRWNAPNNYTFRSYTGTYIDDIEVGQYFEKHVTDVRMYIKNIRTD
jgi:hypothetical protein